MANATLTVNLGALQRNWRALGSLHGTTTETAAVVKADGYGLGACRVAAALNDAGCESFFVAAAEEGLEVRKSVHSANIYVFSGYMADDASVYAAENLIPLLNSPAQLLAWQSDMGNRPYAMQLDSGMNRLGFEPHEFGAIAREVEKSKLLISHLACADEAGNAMNRQQLDCFRQMTDEIAGSGNVPRSLAATGGVLLGDDFHFDMVRPGIGLYGGKPFINAEPVISLSLPVIQTREVDTGESVGYGATWRAKEPSRVATLAAGYADGIFRQLGNACSNKVPENTMQKPRVSFYANGIACPMIGRVSMDLVTVDITALDEPPKKMEFLNTTQGVDAVADIAGTIGYEILTACGNRYQREYVM